MRESSPGASVQAGESIVCPICPSSRAKHVMHKSYTGANITHSGLESVPVDFMRCLSCGVVFTAPLSETASQAVYAWYEKLYRQESESQRPVHPINQARYREWLQMLAPYRGAGKLFETGFGRGEFLLSAAQAGWTCSGNEMSAKACEAISHFGVQAHCGDIASVEARADQNLVVSLGVIEHVKDPHVQFRRYAGLLRQGGAVFITTPNYDSLSRLFLGAACRIFDVEHLFYFTPATITRQLREAGFDVVQCWTQNVNLPELMNALRPQKRDQSAVNSSYQELRTTIESNNGLKLIKRLVNAGIRLVGVGEELYVIAIKS